MARGWESKSVESQQEDQAAAKAARKKPPLTPAERARIAERESQKVALSRARADLKKATHPAHRKMLEAAIATLTEQLR